MTTEERQTSTVSTSGDRAAATADRRPPSETAVERREVVTGEVAEQPVQTPADPELLRREIALTRDDLAHALTSLLEKTHVRARVGSQVTDTRARVAAEVRSRKTTVIASGAGLGVMLAAGVVTLLTVRRKRTATIRAETETRQPVAKRRGASVRSTENAKRIDASAKAREAQARFWKAESKALKAAADKTKKAQANAKKAQARAQESGSKAAETTGSSRDDVRRWMESRRAART